MHIITPLNFHFWFTMYKNIIALTTLCGYSHDMLFKQGTEYINPSELFDA